MLQDVWLIHLFDELRDNVDLFENINEQFLDFLQVGFIDILKISSYYSIQLQIDWTRQPKNVLDRFGIFQINLISCNTKHAQRYLSFLFTIFTIPGRESNISYEKKRKSICSLETSLNCLPLHDFAHETLHQLVQLVPLYVSEKFFLGYSFSFFLELQLCYVQLLNNIFHL